MEDALRDDFELAPAQARPAQSTAVVIPLDEVENAITRTAANYWRMLRGPNALPARSQLSPRDMRAILSNVVLIRVVDGGRDYEYRIVGEMFAWAYRAQFRGRHLTEIEAAFPEHGARMRVLYEHVREQAAPLGLQGWVGHDSPDSPFIYHESVVLPLGDDGSTVDHLLVCGFFVPRAPD